MFAARTSTSSLRSSSSSLLLFSRASFSSTSSVGNNPGKDGPSTMGISRKARLRSTYLTGGGGKVTNETPKRGKDSPFLPGGHLPKSSLETLVSLYHSTQNHITRDTLDAAIDAAFAPMADQPRNDRPLMASLLDLHQEMNEPGSLTRKSSIPNNPLTPTRTSKAEEALQIPSGSTPPAHLAEARQEALDFLHSDPNSPASDPRSTASVLDPAILQGISPLQSSSSQVDPGQAKWLAHVRQEDESAVNDWVGAAESDMTPREKLLVQALYGVEEKMRPGLSMVTGEAKKLEVERERARLETERLEFEDLRREIAEDRIWREEQERRLVERIE
ncbi:hypothetical protein BDY24DRAFT_419003 [Mrakia frigida]|uniref:uncharacterized protein n=1 Tax=Mrakia frigida TaxID=29902 RepID=UPI003FCC19C4